MSTPKKQPFQEAADIVADVHQADVLIINAPISRSVATTVSDLCRRRRRRKNLIVCLVTSGGDAHAAYKMARCFQSAYEQYSLFLTGYCKSAGTLVAIGAHGLIVAANGELGPLDVQMSKPDELGQRQSGLTATAALSTLHEQAFEAFEHFFLTMIRKSGNAISTRTATHVAVQLASGLFAPIYEHVDPMHVGEAGLALQVAGRYGQILLTGSGNLGAETLGHLTAGFPSHEFVIDLAQIKTLFKRVREPDGDEQKLADLLGAAAVNPMSQGQPPLVAYLSTEDAGPQAQVLPGSGTTGEAHEQISVDEHEQSGATDSAQSGTAAAGQPEPSAHPHLAAVGSIRPTGTGGRGETP